MSVVERWSGVLGGMAAVLVLAGLWLLFFGGEDYEARDLRGRTPIIVAAEEGNLERVRFLMDKGVRIDAGDDCNWTAMMRAAAGGYREIMELLLDEGADINHLEKSGYSALMGAVVNNRLETARVLVERGAELDVQETENGQTALMWAARNRNPELVQLLVEAGADSTLTNGEGRTVEDLARAMEADNSEPVVRIREVLGCSP